MPLQKQTLLMRYDAICTRMEQESGRKLTDEEEDEAMRLLHKEVYAEDHDPTPQEIQALWRELIEEGPEMLSKSSKDHHRLLEEIRKIKRTH